MTKKIFALVAAVVLVAAVALSGCGSQGQGNTPAPAGDTIKIGVVTSITGDAAAYGTHSTNGAKLAAEQINAAGGINGKKIELIVEDDEGKPEKAVDAFNKLVDKDKVSLIIGATITKCSLAIAPLAQQQNILMITPTSTNEEVTKFGDYVFRTCFIDPFQGIVAAKFATGELGKKKAAIVYDNGNDYSKGLTTQFEATFAENGGQIVGKEAYSLNDQDFSAILANIKNSDPEVLYIPDYYSKVALIAKQVRDQGMEDVILLGGDGWDEIINHAKDEVVGSFYSNHYSPESDDDQVKSFISAYKEAYNNLDPNAFAALGYDAMQLVAKAVGDAGSAEAPAVRDAMAKISGKFVTGDISFDENRNPVKSAVMIRVEKEGDNVVAKYYSTVNP